MQSHLNAFLFRLNAFPANVPILYPLETLENLWFSGILGSNKVEALTKNGLTNPTALLVKFNFYVNFLTAGLSWENIVEKK